jgi:hypothetical protein
MIDQPIPITHCVSTSRSATNNIFYFHREEEQELERADVRCDAGTTTLPLPIYQQHTFFTFHAPRSG